MLRRREDRTCASSGGGPGRNSGEHNALKSMFGTVRGKADALGFPPLSLSQVRGVPVPMKPSFGRARSDGAISSVMPQTTEVLPNRTRAEDGAVETEPADETRVSGTHRDALTRAKFGQRRPHRR